MARADVDDVDVAAEDVRDDLGRSRLVALALRRRAERDDDLAEDVELDGRDLVVPRELQVGVDQLGLAEVVRPGVERRPDAEPEELPARRGLLATLLDRVAAVANIIPVFTASVTRDLGRLDLVAAEFLAWHDAHDVSALPARET